jgi:hypothetical protein
MLSPELRTPRLAMCAAATSIAVATLRSFYSLTFVVLLNRSSGWHAPYHESPDGDRRS